jgi:putative transcriptional regulator
MFLRLYWFSLLGWNGKSINLKRRAMKNKLKVLRAMNDFTQQDLADKIQVSRQTINTIEKGKYVPSTLLALKMASVFKVNVLEIFEMEDSDWS